MHNLDPNTITPDLLEDFYQDFNDHYQNCETALIELEQEPQDSARVNALFRSVHTIKGNLLYIGLHQLSPLLQGIEDILEQIRQLRFHYDNSLSDVILLAMDKTRQLVDEALAGDNPLAAASSATDFAQLCQALQRIASTADEQRPAAVNRALRLLSPQDNLALAPEQPGSFLETVARMGVQVCDDIRFIDNLVPALELRSGFWQGKTHRSALLALRINACGNRRVTPEQLLMAVLFHDLGMSFLPLEILHKSGRLNYDERRAMEEHVYNSCHLLSNMHGWDEAITMIIQHHERCDGSGYPEGLRGDQICDGAKILAITDTFDACRYSRAYRSEQKRPLLRAISEVNRLCAIEFDEYWVAAFNQVIKQQFTTGQQMP